MSKQKPNVLDFRVDKLTKSIENRISGDSFATEVSSFTKTDLKHITVKSAWLFDWKYELAQNEREVYKLTIVGQPVVQGLMSLTPEIDNVYVHLIESAPFNRGRINCMSESPETLSPLHANFLFNEELRDTFRLLQKQS